MAEVYRARDELLGREVALKVLSERFAGDRSFVERFRREAQSAANLNHPNIVSLFDYGADDGTYFIVMEFIDGRTVGDIIRDEGPLLPERAAEIASDVATALGRAHSNGIVHRDIKPGNIMLTTSGQTKVTDFGIARALTAAGDQTMTQTGVVIGTAAYLSPEQAQGDPVDARSDVYSLGVVLYEMLTGTAPFTGDTPLAIAYKHVRETPQAPSTANKDVPAALDAIVMKALAKNPENRYSSATEMQQDLQRFLAGQKVHATPLLADSTMVAPAVGSRTEIIREDEPVSNRAGWYALSALAILILAALGAWFVWNNLINDEARIVTVPNVEGLDVDEARDLLETRGFEVTTEGKQSRAPRDEVIKQDPEAGTEVEEGSTVTLTYSEGPRQVTVPNVVGLSVEEAEAVLEEARLSLGEQTPEASEEEPGTILDQSPNEDEEVNQGSKVNVIVSSGPDLVSVPNVEGLSQEDAETTLAAADLVADVSTAPSDDVEEGFVISQDPPEGTEVEPGSSVRILVSEGPEEQEMPNVVGQDGDDAEALLEDQYGLDVTQVDEPCADQPIGAVCRQEPEEGTPVEPGDSATLYVQPGGGALDGGSMPPVALALIPLGLFGIALRKRQSPPRSS